MGGARHSGSARQQVDRCAGLAAAGVGPLFLFSTQASPSRHETTQGSQVGADHAPLRENSAAQQRPDPISPIIRYGSGCFSQSSAEHLQQFTERPLRSPGGAPLPLAPRCNRQRPFFVAGRRCAARRGPAQPRCATAVSFNRRPTRTLRTSRQSAERGPTAESPAGHQLQIRSPHRRSKMAAGARGSGRSPRAAKHCR
jgi:hypothetical protein